MVEMDNIYLTSFGILFFSFVLMIFSYFLQTISFRNNFMTSVITSTIISFLFYFIMSLTFINQPVLIFFCFLTLLNIIYVFSVVIYTPKSSIRFKILNLLYLKKKINFNKLNQKYNNEVIFNKRYKRLIESKTIFDNGKIIKILSLKGFFILFIYKFLKLLVGK
tara:strand:+ start:81 stop:572 length:492 start_codon:yes stop_codon:yes gene_type:complete